MVSLGFRKVPDYETLFDTLTKYTHEAIDWKLKKFEEKSDNTKLDTHDDEPKDNN